MTAPHYRGRFAPSPTGPLHFGSLAAAVASFADARHHRGEWLIRIDDLDQTRCEPAWETRILAALNTFGMTTDRPVLRQSDRGARYRAALQQLIDEGHAYRCNCSRRQVASIARVGREGPIYPGTCRRTPPPADATAAWRVHVDDQTVLFTDRIAGETRQQLASEVGDFVIHRIDGFAAYQLAVVVDDHDQGITDVVRGADLLWSTHRQIRLQQLLGYETPRYAHIPLVYGDDGHKLSKQDNAHPVDERRPLDGLRAAWRHLGQADPPARPGGVAGFWAWAAPRWDIARVPCDRKTGHERTDTL